MHADVMGHAGLAGYAEVAMILFLLAFAAILVGTFRPSRKTMDAASRLPLDDDPAKERDEETRS